MAKPDNLTHRGQHRRRELGARKVPKRDSVQGNQYLPQGSFANHANKAIKIRRSLQEFLDKYPDIDPNQELKGALSNAEQRCQNHRYMREVLDLALQSFDGGADRLHVLGEVAKIFYLNVAPFEKAAKSIKESFKKTEALSDIPYFQQAFDDFMGDLPEEARVPDAHFYAEVFQSVYAGCHSYFHMPDLQVSFSLKADKIGSTIEYDPYSQSIHFSFGETCAKSRKQAAVTFAGFAFRAIVNAVFDQHPSLAKVPRKTDAEKVLARDLCELAQLSHRICDGIRNIDKPETFRGIADMMLNTPASRLGQYFMMMVNNGGKQLSRRLEAISKELAL